MPAIVLVGVVFVAAVGWKVYQIVRAPHDRPLRAVTLCLVCAGIALPFGLPQLQSAVNTALGNGAAKLVQNLLLITAAYWLMCFYLYSATDAQDGARRARRQVVPLLATAVVITVATVLTPSSVADRTYSSADMRVPGLAVFYLVAGLYMAYALTVSLRWTWRHARNSARPHSVGLRLAAIAMAAMVVASAFRFVFVLIRWAGGSVPAVLIHVAALALTVAVPLFVIGVTYPGAATRLMAARIWWQHRRTYRSLEPLWSMLHQAFPQDALSPRVPARRWPDSLRLRGVHRGYYRRIIECRDGLVRISPYLADSSTTGPASPSDLAEQVRSALERFQAGESATTTAVRVAIPARDGIDADAEPLVALSRALRHA